MSGGQGDAGGSGNTTTEPTGSNQSNTASSNLPPSAIAGDSSGGEEGAGNQDILIIATRFKRECEERYAIHIRKAESYASQQYWIGVPLVISTALAGISSVGSIAQASSLPWLNGVIIVSALLSAILAPLQTFLNLSDRSVKHQAAAAGYDSLKNRIEVFFLRYPTPQRVVRAEAVDKMEKFAADLSDLKQNSPPI